MITGFLASLVKKKLFKKFHTSVSHENKVKRLHCNIKNKHLLFVGDIAVYFNLTTLMTGRGSIESAEYQKSPIVRSMAVANKFKVITMVFNKGQNRTKIQIHLKGHYANVTQKFEVCICIAVS